MPSNRLLLHILIHKIVCYKNLHINNRCANANYNLQIPLDKRSNETTYITNFMCSMLFMFLRFQFYVPSYLDFVYPGMRYKSCMPTNIQRILNKT